MDKGDRDLLLQRSDHEDRVMQWLQALDMQVMGACRVDERLKPLLKMNTLNGVAEDRLLVHLSQHFEPAEVGMLRRCFCIPLVSFRVGKINKQGTHLCPTAIRLVAERNLEWKQKLQKSKPKASEGRKHLSDVRVIQRNLVYIIGLPLSLADEDLLQRRQYFGQYGKVSKVSISHTANGVIQHSSNNSCCVYITYSKEEEAA